MGARLRAALVLVSCAALAGAAGCQKDRALQLETEGDEAAAQNASRPIAPERGRTAMALDSWSADAEAIVGIDAVQFRESPLGAFADNLLRTLVTSSAGCRDVVDDARQVLIVTMREHTGQPIFVFDGVAREHTESCSGATSLWLDADTLVIASGWQQEQLHAVTSGKSGGTNRRLLATISEIDTGAAMWFAAAPASESQEWGEEFRELRGTVLLRNGLRASFDAKYADRDRAATAAVEFEHGIETMTPFSQYFEDAGATAEGEWLHAHIVMSRDQLARFASDPMFSVLAPPPDDADVTIAD